MLDRKPISSSEAKRFLFFRFLVVLFWFFDVLSFFLAPVYLFFVFFGFHCFFVYRYYILFYRLLIGEGAPERRASGD